MKVFCLVGMESTGGRKGVYPMNNAAMSGTHYPLDKEPRGRIAHN